jgi:hypothetical protein
MAPTFGNPLDDLFAENLRMVEPSSLTYKGKRGHEFTIHVDDDCREPASKKGTASENSILKMKGANKPAAKKKPVPQKVKVYKTKSGRTILGETSGNSSRTPSPRCPTTPYALNPSDVNWENQENWSPNMSPVVSTPATSVYQGSPSPSPRFDTQHTRVQTEPGNAFVHVDGVHIPRPLPCNTTLYREFDVPTWATKKAIKAAFKRLALIFHPDKHQGHMFTEAYANQMMERLLAAREVLLDDVLRAKYDADGILPTGWTFDG